MCVITKPDLTLALASNPPSLSPATCTPPLMLRWRHNLAPASTNFPPKTSTTSTLSRVSSSALPALLRKVTSKCFTSLPLFTDIFTLSLGRCLAICSVMVVVWSIFTPSMAMIISPLRMPASDAALPSPTDATYAPPISLMSNSLPISSMKRWSTGRYETPSSARCTTPYSFRSITTLLTMVSGTAKEYPI